MDIEVETLLEFAEKKSTNLATYQKKLLKILMNSKTPVYMIMPRRGYFSRSPINKGDA